MSDHQNEDKTINMQSVLQFAIENSSVQEPTPQEELDAELNRDPQRKEWLRKALGSMCTDMHKEMKKAIQILTNLVEEYGAQESLPDDAIEKLEDASDNLVEVVSSIDFAQDFVKMDGYGLLKKMIQASCSKFALCAFDVLAETLQNNEYCQSAACNHGFMKILVQILNSDAKDNVLVKALYALSCLIRANGYILKAFEDLNGLELLLRLLDKQSDSGKLRIKVAFLISDLCQKEPRLQEIFREMQIVTKIVSALKSPRDQSHEHLLSALCALISNNQAMIKECQKVDLGLRIILEEKISSLSGKDECREEVNYSKTLLKSCFR